jgi:hypothetical protein
MGPRHFAPLFVVEDVLLGPSSVVLLPAVPREGLPVGRGDVVDVVQGDAREEVEVLGLESDRDPRRVRLRIASTRIRPGCEIWPSRDASHVRSADRSGQYPASHSPVAPARRRA